MIFKEGRMSSKGDFTIFKNTKVLVSTPLPDNIDLGRILSRLESEIPWHFCEDLDVIYIGIFDFLIDRELNALYQDGAVYVSSVQDDEEDLYDDLAHEIAHCVEESYTESVYGDDTIESEFLVKRKQLFNILKSEGLASSIEPFMEPRYNKSFDEYLYIEVGYPVLMGLTKGLFVSPYGATSLREYFANCFEEIYAKKNAQHVKKLSPTVYKKILSMTEDY